MLREGSSSDPEYLQTKPCLRSAHASLQPIEDILVKASRVCAWPKGAHPACFFFCVCPGGLQKDLKELKWELNSSKDWEH